MGDEAEEEKETYEEVKAAVEPEEVEEEAEPEEPEPAEPELKKSQRRPSLRYSGPMDEPKVPRASQLTSERSSEVMRSKTKTWSGLMLCAACGNTKLIELLTRKYSLSAMVHLLSLYRIYFGRAADDTGMKENSRFMGSFFSVNMSQVTCSNILKNFS